MDDSQIVLFADFDSGNMARYERVYKNYYQAPLATAANSSSTSSMINNNNNNSQINSNVKNSNSNTDNSENTIFQPKYDVEFNIWTRPDCDGTPVGPNGNRTWFYFGVRGGHGKFLKFNLMNLNRQGRLFEMGMLPVFKTVPGHEKWSRIYSKPTWQNLETNFLMSFIHRIPDKRDSITYFAFCFPFSYDECQTMLDKLDKQFEYCKYLNPDNCEPDTIYYHRELFCHSIDKRRIDLITVSACNDLTFKREPRFDPDLLFPKDDASKRCFKFDQKRVFVLTSRVHPGETPASFVFNGFLEFILRKDDPRAKLLRKHFVFKLIPMLNPDGVSRGHYRTDQLGVNLNRVYLDPDYGRHPSIYAVKSLLVYHHVNNRTSKEHDGLNFEKLFKLEFDKEELKNRNLETIKANILTDEPTQSPKKVLENLAEPSLVSISSSSSSNYSNSTNNKRINFNFHRSKSFAIPATENSDFSKFSINRSLDMRNFSKVEIACELEAELDRNEDRFEKRIGNENSDDDGGIVNFQTNKSVNSPHLNDSRLAQINPFWSGIAFYMDLHGHAAKRGCFIYGNSIDNELYQVENVLFAKLISFNTQHFDFEGSNFSVKNMYMKDKREGLSKEGSGRVAMFKTLGIIHSYTLECCYASGRVMNSIAPALNRSGVISPPLHTDLPPKFMPEHYADVGKAIAIAALDIVEMNPHTRIPNTSFGNLEAVRNWIKFFIRSKNGGAVSSQNNNNNNISSSQVGGLNANNKEITVQSASISGKKPLSQNQKFLTRQSQKISKFISNQKNSSSVQEPIKATNQLANKVNMLAKSTMNPPVSKSTNTTLKKSQTPQDMAIANRVSKSQHQKYSIASSNQETLEDADKVDVTKPKKSSLNPSQASISYKPSNFSFMGNNNNDKLTTPASNLLQFNQFHTQFRNSIQKMKDLEIPMVKSTTPTKQTISSLSLTAPTSKNEDNLEYDSKWYSNLEPAQQQTDIALASGKAQTKIKPLTRKLMPLNKATVISSNLGNLITGPSQILNFTSTSSSNANIVLFNKITSDLASKNQSISKLNVKNSVLFCVSNEPNDLGQQQKKKLSKAKSKKEATKASSEPIVFDLGANSFLTEQTETINPLDEIKEKNESIDLNTDLGQRIDPIETKALSSKKKSNFIRKSQSITILNESRK